MPWFRIDDGFGDHPKVRRIPLAQRFAAVGLWTVAGTWAARNTTDGHVPEGYVDEQRGARQLAGALVAVKLWHPVDGMLGCAGCVKAFTEAGIDPVDLAGVGPGWIFHEWPEHQPTRAETLDKREKRARAGRLGGVRSGESRRGSGSKTEANASLLVEPPARPGPARTKTPLLTLVSRLAAGDAGAYPGPPAEQIAAWQDLAGSGVDLEAEAAAYLIRHGDRPARDERGAWIGWLRAAARRHAPPVPRPRPACGACHDGWLPDDHEGRPVPCPTCRPHLQPVPDQRQDAS